MRAFLKGKWCVVQVAALLGTLLLPQAVLAGNTVKFTATLLQSACEISFLDGSGQPISSLDLGSINSASLSSPVSGSPNTSIANPATPISLKLKGCGLGQNGKTPVIILKGTQAKGPEVTAGNGYPYKFRDSGLTGGTSREYFVVVGKALSLTYDTSPTTGLYPVNTRFSGTKDTSGEGYTVPLYVAVSCDKFCNAGSTAQAGSLNASLVFDFLYQ